MTMIHLAIPEALFIISCKINGECYYLRNLSTISNTLKLEKNITYSKIQDYLFMIHEANEQLRDIPKRYYEPITIKHKYSDKYLNHQKHIVQNSDGNQLILSHQPKFWTVLPSFKYQTKNTQSIYFNDRVYLYEQYYNDINSRSITVFQLSRDNEQEQLQYSMMFGFSKVQLVFIFYENNRQQNYHLGQSIKIYHQQSYSYLVDETPISAIFNQLDEDQDSKKAILSGFKKQTELSTQNIFETIWTIQKIQDISKQTIIQGKLNFETVLVIKNVFSNNYMTLINNSVDDENYSMLSTAQFSKDSCFVIEPVFQSQFTANIKSQIRIKHNAINQYMAVSKHRESHKIINIMMDYIPQDQHFYDFRKIQFHKQLSIYFLLNLKKQLQIIKSYLQRGNLMTIKIIDYWQIIYIEILKDINLMLSNELSYKLLKMMLKYYISMIAQIVRLLQLKIKDGTNLSESIKRIISFNYNLLKTIIKDSNENKNEAAKHINLYISNLFDDMSSEQLIIEIYSNNRDLLFKIFPQINRQNGNNIIRSIVKRINFQDKKTEEYWAKLLKILDIFYHMIKCQNQYIDINQRLIAQEIFDSNNLFQQIFFSISIKKSMIFLTSYQSDNEFHINNLKDPFLITIVTKTLDFLIELTMNRNIRSKIMIDNKIRDIYNPLNVKTIINIFYLRNTEIKHNFLLLFANIYLDSYPRIKQHHPILTIKIQNLMKKKITKDMEEQVWLQDQLRQNLLQSAQRSSVLQPISSMHYSTHHQSTNQLKNQPSFSEHQLHQFIKIIILLFQKEQWSLSLLKTINIILKFDIIEESHILQIYNTIFKQINSYGENQYIISQLLEIIQEIDKKIIQKKLQTFNSFLSFLYYSGKQHLQQDDVNTFFGKREIEIHLAKKQENIATIIFKYNENVRNLRKIYNNDDQNVLIELYINNKYKSNIALKLIQILIMRYQSDNIFSKLLSKSSVIPVYQVKQYEKLKQYTIKLNNMLQISQQWLCNQELSPTNFILCSKYITQITNYLFQQYQLDTQNHTLNTRKNKLNLIRQVLIKNLGVHQYIISFLKGNFYLLEGQSLRLLKKKIRNTFQQCFQFLFLFTIGCQQNKHILVDELDTLTKYTKLLQTGQSKLWISLIKNQKKILQQISINDIQLIILKIIKDKTPDHYVNCDFNPNYIEQLMILIDIYGKFFMPNVQKIALIFQEAAIVKKLLFLKQSMTNNNRNSHAPQFCIQLHKLRLDPIQIPIVYHTKLIHFLSYMINCLGTSNTLLRRNIKSILSIDYIFFLLSFQDIYSHDGIPAELNFIFKLQLIQLLKIYLKIPGIQNQIYNCIYLDNFLDHFKVNFTNSFLKRNIQAGNEGLYYQYLIQYESIILSYKKSSLKFYEKLKPIFEKLFDVFDKLPVNTKNKIKSYVTLRILLSEKQLKLKRNDNEVFQDESLKRYIPKWPNLLPNSSKSDEQQKTSKRYIYETLRNPTTNRFLQDQSTKLFAAIQKKEENFINTLQVFINTLSLDFSISLQKEIFNFMFLLYRYLNYKMKKPLAKVIFDPPEIRLTDNFQKIILPILKILRLSNFQYKRVYCRKIYYYSVSIINIILSNTKTFDLHEQIYNVFKQQQQNINFFLSMKNALDEMVDQEPIQSIVEQINYANEQISFHSEQKQIEPLLPTLRFLQELCRYEPFTYYLRQQDDISSINFLSLIFKNLFHALSIDVISNLFQKNKWNIVDIKRIQYLSDSLSMFFVGCNKKNQLYVTNKKFLKQIEQIFKIDELQVNRTQKYPTFALMRTIKHQYSQTIPQFQYLLLEQLKLFKYTHPYVLQSLKYSLLKIIISVIKVNQQAKNIIKAFFSLQLLKLNLIWIHQELPNFKDQTLNQSNFIETQNDWRYIYTHEDEYRIKLFLPICLISLIRQLQETYSMNEYRQKNKQKNKILLQNEQNLQDINLYVPENMKLLLSELKDDPFFQPILLLFKKYYIANKYFSKHILHVQIKLKTSQISRQYFPIIPMCHKLTSDMQLQLYNQTNRSNQQQKNKSLLIKQQDFFDEINDQQILTTKLITRSPKFQTIIKIFQKKHIFFSLYLLINTIISLLYLVANYHFDIKSDTSISFTQELFKSYLPLSINKFLLMICLSFNLIFCVIITIHLIIKKIPFYFYFQIKKYHKLNIKQKVGLNQYIKYYTFNNLISSINIDLFFIILTLLSIIHPLFSSFIILYFITRLSMGRIVINAVAKTKTQLFTVSIVLMVFNFVFAVFVYVSLTTGTSYGTICSSIQRCMKMLMDFLVKGGFLFYLDSDYENNTFGLKFLAEAFYTIFIMNIIFSIFGGVLIDKFSQLRQNSEFISFQQKSKCFICGQSQFSIDFELQGFEEHNQKTHNRKNYIFYSFYLRKKPRQKYIYSEDYVNNLMQKGNYNYFPYQDSIFYQNLKKENKEDGITIQQKMIKITEQKQSFVRKVAANSAKTKNQLCFYLTGGIFQKMRSF